jgi:succinate dehydrogenase/fumarate reductase flavoprotein subunit
LFAVGECAGTHGIARPGGSALNAGQVGSLRAAQYISAHPGTLMDEKQFSEICAQVEITFFADAKEQIRAAQRRMSDHAAAVRDTEKIKATLETTLSELKSTVDPNVRDVLLTQAAVLTAMSQPQPAPDLVQEIVLTEKGFELTTRPVRPIPQEDAFFENVWREYRQNKNIY